MSNIFWPVHAYSIKQWEIYFSSNVQFYNMMDRSNFWSMQLFQTGPHFKLEEVWFWKGIFPSWHNRLNPNVRGSGNIKWSLERYLLLAELIFEQYVSLAEGKREFEYSFGGKMRHILLKSGKYLNNWGFCCHSSRYRHATQIEHLPKFELKPSILNPVVPQVLLHNLTK